MNIANAVLQAGVLSAGGPGSGRHKEDFSEDIRDAHSFAKDNEHTSEWAHAAKKANLTWDERDFIACKRIAETAASYAQTYNVDPDKFESFAKQESYTMGYIPAKYRKYIQAGGPGSGWTSENGHVPQKAPLPLQKRLRQVGFKFDHATKLADHFKHDNGMHIAFGNRNKWRVGNVTPNASFFKLTQGKGFQKGKGQDKLLDLIKYNRPDSRFDKANFGPKPDPVKDDAIRIARDKQVEDERRAIRQGDANPVANPDNKALPVMDLAKDSTTKFNNKLADMKQKVQQLPGVRPEAGERIGKMLLEERAKLRGKDPRDAVGNLPSDAFLPKTKPVVNVPGIPAADATPAEKSLLTTPVKEGAYLGGGASGSYKIKFADGSAAVFKPESGECQECRDNIKVGLQTAREVGAYQVAKLVGMHDMVAPTVEREVDTPDGGGIQKGSLQQWQEGDLAGEVNSHARFDGDRDLNRAAVFDYVIGNTDRHARNWLVDQPNNALKLIDHGLSFPEKPTANDGWRRAANEAFMNESDNRGIRIKDDVIKPYFDNKGAIMKALKNLGFSKPAINGVVQRIDNLKLARGTEPFMQLRQLDEASDYGSLGGLRKESGNIAASSGGLIRIMKTVGMKQESLGSLMLQNGKIVAMGRMAAEVMTWPVINKRGIFDAQHNPSEWLAGLPQMSNGYIQFEQLGAKPLRAHKKIKSGGPGSGRTKEEDESLMEMGFMPEMPIVKTTKPSGRLKKYVSAGGPGSGRHRGFSSQAERPITNAKHRAALMNYKPADRLVHQKADFGESLVREAIGGVRTANDMPFDVLTPDGNHAIEVKTMINNSNDKITMRASALSRKMSWAIRNKAMPHTVVLDMRNGVSYPTAVYYRPGVGSFRVSSMKLLSNGLDSIRKVIH